MFSKNEPFFLIHRGKGPYKMPTPHFHTCHELYFLISGKTKYFVDGKIFILSAGDIIFIPEGEFHQTEYPEPDKIERVIITFNNAFVGEKFNSYINTLSEHKHFSISKSNINIFDSLIRKLELEQLNKQQDYQNMEKLYMCQLLIMLSRHTRKPNRINLSSSYQMVQNSAKYINANYNQPLTLNFMAEKYSVSPDYFSKIFKKASGVGFSEYLNITRISAAQELLVTTKMSVTDISMECGFNDSNYFIQVFKKVHGITPKKYSMQFKNK